MGLPKTLRGRRRWGEVPGSSMEKSALKMRWFHLEEAMISNSKWRECFIQHFQKTEICYPQRKKKNTTTIITYSMGQINSEYVTDLNITDKIRSLSFLGLREMARDA